MGHETLPYSIQHFLFQLDGEVTRRDEWVESIASLFERVLPDDLRILNDDQCRTLVDELALIVERGLVPANVRSSRPTT